MGPGEIFALIVMVVGAAVLIKFLDWLLGGVGEAFGLDETPWGDVVCLPPEARVRPTAANSDAGGSGSQERQQASVQTQEDTSFQRPLWIGVLIDAGG